MKRELLIHLAEQGLFSETSTSTRELSRKLGRSQQSVSRLLIELEKEGKIKRTSSPGGVMVSLQKKGIEELREEFLCLRRIFDSEDSFDGLATEGFGEGKYYIEKYRRKIKDVLGFEPFLGTLNVRAEAAKVKSFLMDMSPLRIESFHDGIRSFGAIEIFRVKVNGVSGALLRPERTRHEEGVVEIIAEVDLRKKLKLNGKKKVEVTK